MKEINMHGLNPAKVSDNFDEFLKEFMTKDTLTSLMKKGSMYIPSKTGTVIECVSLFQSSIVVKKLSIEKLTSREVLQSAFNSFKKNGSLIENDERTTKKSGEEYYKVASQYFEDNNIQQMIDEIISENPDDVLGVHKELILDFDAMADTVFSGLNEHGLVTLLETLKNGEQKIAFYAGFLAGNHMAAAPHSITKVVHLAEKYLVYRKIKQKFPNANAKLL